MTKFQLRTKLPQRFNFIFKGILMHYLVEEEKKEELNEDAKASIDYVSIVSESFLKHLKTPHHYLTNLTRYKVLNKTL